MDRILEIKVGIAAVIASLTAFWGWFGWIAVLYCVCMIGDYATGSIAALYHKKWTSRIAREGIMHKAGSIMVVLVAGATDLLIGTLITNIHGITLPFEYTVLLCPIVIVWYILTELGSIVENAVSLGAPCPKWLGTIIDKTLEAVDAAGQDNSISPDKKE